MTFLIKVLFKISYIFMNIFAFLFIHSIIFSYLEYNYINLDKVFFMALFFLSALFFSISMAKSDNDNVFLEAIPLIVELSFVISNMIFIIYLMSKLLENNIENIKTILDYQFSLFLITSLILYVRLKFNNKKVVS